MPAVPVELTSDGVTTPAISVVLPMRNESRGLDKLFGRLVPALQALRLSFEIITVDDGSTDDTFARLKALRASVPNLRVVSLSRNFGKEIAVTAGLARSSGQVVVLMDSDLQHPPEAIAALYAPWAEKRAAVVYARRTGYDRGGYLRTHLTSTFYRLFDMMSEVKIDRSTGDFLLLDRRVVDAFLNMPERNRFNRGLLSWAGFKSVTVDVAMEAREFGGSQWGMLKLVRLAMNAITSFGTLPLRVWTYIGGAVSAVALLYGLYFTVHTLIFGADVPGFPSLIVAIMLSSGVQLIGLGIIGEYIGHVFSEVKRRPLYFVDEAIGFDEPVSPAAVTAEAKPTVDPVP